MSTTTAADPAPAPAPAVPEKKGLVGWILYKVSQADLLPSHYEMNRFIEAGKKRGIEINVIRPEQLDLIVTREDRKSIRLDGKVVALPDFVIPRQGAVTPYFSLAIIRHLERLGVLILNDSNAIECVKDKLYTQQILAKNEFPLPKTMLVKFPLNPELVEKVLGLPVVVKVISGSQGSGVYLAETKSSFEDVLTLIESTKSKANIILQEFIANTRGRDLRVFVVGGRPIACMERRSTDGSFKANISRGGEPKPYPMNLEIEMLAVEASRVLNLDIAGVDLLFDTDHFKICEVNSSPGFKGLEAAHPGLNTADLILQYAEMRLGVFRSPEDEMAPPKELAESNAAAAAASSAQVENVTTSMDEKLCLVDDDEKKSPEEINTTD